MASHGLLHPAINPAKIKRLLLVNNAIIFAIILFNPLGIGFICKFILGKWIYSTSNGAQLSFLFYISAIVLCFHDPKKNLSTRPPETTTTSLKKIFFFASLIGFAVTFYLNILYYRALSIPFSAHVFHWLENQFTFNSILHNHQGKLIFSYLSSALSNPSSNHYDLARPLLSHAHVGWIYVLSLMWIVSVYAGTRLTLERSQRESDLLYTLSLALAYFIILKNMIDGGILNYNTIPSYLFIFSDDLKKHKKLIFMALLLLHGFFYLLIFNQLYFLYNLIFIDLYFFLLLLMRDKKQFTKIKIACLITLALLMLADAFSNLRPLFKKPIADAKSLYYCDLTCKQIPAKTYQGLRMWQIYEKYETDPFKLKHLVYIENLPFCSFGKFKFVFKLLTLHQNHGELESNGLFSIVELKKTENNWLQLSIQPHFPFDRMFCLNSSENILYRNNYFVFLWQMNSILQKSGVKEYIVLGY